MLTAANWHSVTLVHSDMYSFDQSTSESFSIMCLYYFVYPVCRPDKIRQWEPLFSLTFLAGVLTIQVLPP